MPNPTEICVVTINGEVFRDWKTVSAVASAQNSGIRTVTLTIAEKVGSNGAVGQALQIKPGPETIATVTFAGVLFCTGRVYERQSSYDKENHGVRIVICGAPMPLTHCSVPLKTSQFKNYTYEAIARALIQPFGINFKIASKPDGFDKIFAKVAVIPGEPIWAFLERLARSRGAKLSDDENGNLVIHSDKQIGSTAGLVEGKNILFANAIIKFPQGTNVTVVGQQPGSDTITPDQARGSAASVQINGVSGYLPIIVHHEGAADADDAKRRTDYEQTYQNATAVQATVTVQGWLKDDGNLWNIRDFVNVNSPMLYLANDLQIAETVFLQDQNGTTTKLTLLKNVSAAVEAGSSETPAATSVVPNITNGMPQIEST